MTGLNKPLNDLIEFLDQADISGWEDISRVLAEVKDYYQAPKPDTLERFLEMVSQGTAFLTFDFGIDGVSIEISKYARLLESIFSPHAEAKLHFIGGDFYPQADSILKSSWLRRRIDGINGWAKWDEGYWFDALFFDEMKAGTERSREIASEIYRQSTVIARRLGDYLVTQNINLLVPVNVASNPGNMALTLALVFVTEALGTFVINSNHDYYWDGGKPVARREPSEEPGSRDHFFRNTDNRSFFSLFRLIYPWNGRRWLQVNINHRQSKKLIRDGFPKQKVFKINTSVREELFDDYGEKDVISARLRMAYILSNGAPLIRSTSTESFMGVLDSWMEKQRPQVIGSKDNLILDLTADNIIYMLQPTRVIARKRIEKGVELIQALLQGPLRSAFERERERQLVLHISGPTPLEHRDDLEIILQTYQNLVRNLPPHINERCFLAFSGGHQSHPSFDEEQFENLRIAEIYRMATVVLFPSEIEGRGLPIIESGAVGIPIICSRYRPDEVFADVVGEGLAEELQIRYLLFPEDEFTEVFLQHVADILLQPDKLKNWQQHNRQAVRQGYSEAALRKTFQLLLEKSYELSS